MKIDLHFTENSDGTIEFTPIDVDRARLIYRQLIESLSYLRKKIDAKQNLLDITPKENDDTSMDPDDYSKFEMEAMKYVEQHFSG